MPLIIRSSVKKFTEWYCCFRRNCVCNSWNF